MRANMTGVVVQLESKPWDFNGNKGVSYWAYLRDPQDVVGSAQRVTVSAVQYGGIAQGEQVAWPVDVFANVNDRTGQGKLSVKLPEDFDVRAGAFV